LIRNHDKDVIRTGGSMRLYEIVESINRILVNDELTAEEQGTALDHLDLAFDAKMGNLAQAHLNLQSDIMALDAEIRRLKSEKERVVNSLGRVASYCKHALEGAGRDKAGTGTYGVSLRTAPRKVVVLDEDRIHEDWYRTEVVHKLDRKKMIEEWDGRKPEHADILFGFKVVRERYPKFPKIQTNTERSDQE
jgi:hypothetical protein